MLWCFFDAKVKLESGNPGMSWWNVGGGSPRKEQ